MSLSRSHHEYFFLFQISPFLALDQAVFTEDVRSPRYYRNTPHAVGGGARAAAPLPIKGMQQPSLERDDTSSVSSDGGGGVGAFTKVVVVEVYLLGRVPRSPRHHYNSSSTCLLFFRVLPLCGKTFRKHVAI